MYQSHGNLPGSFPERQGGPLLQSTTREPRAPLIVSFDTKADSLVPGQIVICHAAVTRGLPDSGKF